MKTKRQAAVDCPIQFVNFIFLITISLYNNQEIILKTHHRWWATKRCCSNESPHGNDQIILNCGLSSIFLIEVTSIEGYKVGHFSSEIHINVNFPFRIFCFCFLFFFFFKTYKSGWFLKDSRTVWTLNPVAKSSQPKIVLFLKKNLV